MIGEKEIVFSKPLYIGVQVRHEDNSFYPWIFSNFIQINCDVNCTHRRLDYSSFYKDEEYDLISYFLDRNRFASWELIKMGGIQALKQEILKGHYVELKIDQYYLSGHEEYHVRHHLHQNLIYGYDDRLHTFLTLGYSNVLELYWGLAGTCFTLTLVQKMPVRKVTWLINIAVG